MTQQVIDIGVQGNDGTGDSIRDSFRKVNENFNEIYAVFGAGGTIPFTALSDAPTSYTDNQMFITGRVNGVQKILAKNIIGTTGVTVDYTSDPTTIIVKGQLSNLSNDEQPRLRHPMDANYQPIGNIPDPSDTIVANFNSAFTGIASTTIDKLPISKGYADNHYLKATAGTNVTGAVRLRDEPVSPDITDADSPLNPLGASYDTTLTSNYLATEAVQRKHIVYRGGDAMTGKLTLSDHPGNSAGAGTPNGSDDLQAATKYYVDNKTFASGINLFVSTSTGDDSQLRTPAGNEGRFWNYAYKTIGAAALQAQNLISLASLEPGPYRQKIAYTISPNQYYSTITSVGLTGGNYSNQGYLDATYLLESNRTFIQTETIAYINYKYVNTFTYDQAKFQTNISTVLKSTSQDLVLSTNFNSLQAGTSYFNYPSSATINSQLVQTIDGINQALSQVLNFTYSNTNLTTFLNKVVQAVSIDMLFGSNYQSIIVGRSYASASTGLSVVEMASALNFLYSDINGLVSGVSADTTIQTLVKNNINTIISIIQTGINPTATIPGLNSSVYTSPTSYTSATTLLLNNISFIQAEIISYLGSNYPNLAYSQATCKRDVGYIVQALAYDQLYGGNSMTIYAGQRYWYNSVRQIAKSEVTATAAAMTYLNVLVQAVVQNQSPAQVFQTAVIQYQNQSYSGGSARVNTLSNLVSIISGFTGTVTSTASAGGLITTSSTINLSPGMPITFATTASITISGKQLTSGTGPFLVSFLIPVQATAPTLGTAFTVAGNSNTSYNGVFNCTASSTTSITLSYASDPGAYGSGTTTVTPYLGGITAGASYFVLTVNTGTQFTISTQVNGTAVALQNTSMNVSFTYDGLIKTNVAPNLTTPITSNAPAARYTVYGSTGINNPDNLTKFVSDTIGYINSTYPYINNSPAITGLTANFKTVTDTLSGGLANRPVFTFTPPSSLSSTPWFVNSATLITKNYAFVQAEILGWIKQFYPSFNFVAADGAQQFAKDVQILMEATAYDMIYGGNSGSNSVASQYWYTNSSGQPTSTIDSSETTVKTLALAYVQTLVGNIGTNNTPGQSYQAYVTNYVTYSSKTGTGPYLVTLNLATARVIPMPVGTIVTLQGQSNTAYNVNSNVVSSTTTSITLSYASDPGAWSVVTPTSFVIAQFLDPTGYNTKNLLGSNTPVTDIITSSWTLINSVIATNSAQSVVSPDLTNSSYASTGYVDVRTVVVNNATTIAQTVASYINTTYKGGFSYNQSTCYRDIGLIIDAMTIDLLTGGTYQSINAGKSYYKNSSAKSVAIGTQNTETIDGIVFARKLALQVLNQTSANRYQSLSQQLPYDSQRNANAGYTATATFSSVIGTTLTVSGISGSILVGMTVTGSGFISGQVVTAVNGSTITISAASDSTPSNSSTLTFTLTAITTFTNNYATMLNIVTNGIAVAPTPSFGSGVYTVAFGNGGNGNVDQGVTGDIKILSGKILRGVTSGVTGTIINYTQGSTNSSDNVTINLTSPGFFQILSTTATANSGSNILTVATNSGTTIGNGATAIAIGMGVSGTGIPTGVTVLSVTGTTVTISALTIGAVNGTVVFAEQLEYAESVPAQQITIMVEAGIYYEDYPIKVPANVSIRGDEFRRTIVRPLDRISQSPWRGQFFYRDSVIDGLAIGPINNGPGATDYAPGVAITSKGTTTGSGPYLVTFNIPTQTSAPSTSIQYTVSGNTNISYNGTFAASSSTASSITLSYPSNPGTYSSVTTSYIGPLAAAALSGSSGAITITLSNNIQATSTWLGYVFQADSVDSYGKHGQAVVNSVSGNFMNCTVIYPFAIPGTLSITSITGTFSVNETITQASTGAVGVVTQVLASSLIYTPTTGTFVINNTVIGGTSGASATISAVALTSIAAGSWHLYTTNNYGRHYLTDPTQSESATNKALNNREIDVFLCNDAVRISNLTAQGHGGFMMVLDPEGQIKSKSPYGQVCTSFSRSLNKQTFAGGQFVDGFTGRLFGSITGVSLDGFTVTATGGVNSGLDIRAPQAPCAFYVTGNRYQINAISSYSQIFDGNGNVVGGTATFIMSAATPWTAGTGQAINIEMGGNKSMLANDFAQVNDLGYAILATNGGITEQVSTFTYYCWTAFWALNGGQIRSVGSSSAHGIYALRASGYDVTELPDSVNLANNLAQAARIFNPPNLPQSSVANQYYNNMNTNSTTVYIIGYDYYPTNISELEIDHSLAGKGVSRYQINSVSHTTIYVPTGSVGTDYAVNVVTYNPTGSSGTTLVVTGGTAGITPGMTVTGSGFRLGQQVVSLLADNATLILTAPPEFTPTGSLYIGDTATIPGSLIGGKSSSLSGNTVTGSNIILSVSTLAAVTPSAGLLVIGYASKTLITGTTYQVVFNIPTQGSSPSQSAGYTVYGNTTAGYNGSVSVVGSSLNTITVQYTSDPGTYSSTTATVIMPPGITISGASKSGSAPSYLVQYTIPTQTSAPLVGGYYTIAGNSATGYNGTYISTASSTTSVTLRYVTDPGTYGTGTTTVTFMGSTISGPYVPFGSTALATYQNNQIILSQPATATAAGSTFSSNSGNDITVYVQTLVNTALATFSYTGNAVSGATATYSNVVSNSSSGTGQYAYFNITVTAGVYSAVTLGGQNVLALNLSTSAGSSGYSSTGLSAPLYDGQLISIRVLQNFKFLNVNNVNPTRPSTAVQFNDNLASIYRVLSYNLTEATNEVLPNHIAILSTDQSFAYYIFQADTSRISSVDPIDGGSKTMGATPGDTRIAVTTFGPQSYIDQINKGTYAFAWGGRVHAISGYTPPVTTVFYTGYNPSGSSGTTLVVGGTFTGNIATGIASITNVSSLTGLVVGEIISGTGIPTGATIISINTAAGSLSISASATATTTGLTITYGGTTGFIAGMTVTGTGFTSGQTITGFNSTTVTLSAVPNSTPSGTLVFTFATIPYITLGSIKYSIANNSVSTSTVPFLLQQSRGQVAAVYNSTGNFTGITTSGSNYITGASSLTNVGAGSFISGTNIPGQQVVTATATTQNVAVMSNSTINSSGVLTVGTVSSGTVAVGMQLNGVNVVQAQNLQVIGTSGNNTTAVLTLNVPTPTLIATAQTGSFLTLSSVTGIAVNQTITFTSVSQTPTTTGSTNATFSITGSSIVGTTLTVGTVGSGTVAVGYQLTGSGVVAGTYITALITGSGGGSTWTVSQNHAVSTGSIAITGTLNAINVGSTSGLVVGEPVLFTATIGGLSASPTVYYISEVINATSFSVVSSYGATSNATVTTGSTITTVTAGSTLGGITSGTPYYVLSVNSGTNQITVSTSYGGSIFSSLTNANGTWTSVAGNPYVVGGSITVSGLTTTGYNGTYLVSASTVSTVSYLNSTTGAIPVVTATYSAGGAASTTLTVIGVLGGTVAVGMTISGTGFTSGQTVTSIINSTSFSISGFADSQPSGTLTFKQLGLVTASGPTYIVSNISGSGGGSTWQTSTALAVSSTTITGTNNLVTLSSTTGIVAGNTIQFDPTSGSSFGGISTGTNYFIKQVLTGSQVILSAFSTASTYTNNGPYTSAIAVTNGGTGSIVGRTDNVVISTNTTGTFTGNTAINSNIISNIPVATFNYLALGNTITGGSGGPIPGSTVITLINATNATVGSLPAYSIQVSNNSTQNQTAFSITYSSNTLVISGAASATGNAQYLTFTNLTNTISIYTSDRTQYIAAGMTVFGNGFTSGQTVISAVASTSGAPTTTITLSAAPNTTPFGTLGFTLLTTATGPWYTTFTMATQAVAPTVDCYYYINGNSNTKYNGWVQAVASTTNSITFAYQTDPESTVVVTYVSNIGTALKISNTTGITTGMVIRGGGAGGFFAGQTVTAVGTDGLSITTSAGPAGTPTGSLTFTLPYGTGTTSFTSNISGISRPMSSSVSSALQAGYQAGSFAQITTRISTCRCSAHDLLDIGTGGYNTTNYPYQIYGNPFIKADQTKEILEETVGRVFYVTTDQNGIFRVGRFFTVDQGTGTVTFSASIALSNLNGLGFKRGVVIAEFSTDSTMTNDASDTVPTQSAVRGYVDNRLGVQQSGATTPATALIGNGFMELKGTLPMKGNMSMGGYTVGSLGNPLLSTDATNKGYVDTVVASINGLGKLSDIVITSAANNNILVYNATNSKWQNAGFSQGVLGSAFSDVLISYNGTTLTNTIQGSIVTATYTTVNGVNLTVSSTVGILPGMTVSGNGFTSSQTVVSITNSVILVLNIAPDSTPSGTLTFTRAGVIVNNKVNSYAAITQTKLALSIATANSTTAPTYNNVQSGLFVIGRRYTIVSPGSTTWTSIGSANNLTGTTFQATGSGDGNGYARELDTIQASNGISSYNSNIFTVTDGWVTLKDATNTGVDGIAPSKHQFIAANSVLANVTSGVAALTAVTTQAMVANGDGIRNQDIPISTSTTGAIIRTGTSPSVYDVTPITQTGGNSSLVKTDNAGNIDIKGIKIGSLPTLGNMIDSTSTLLSFYTPNSSASTKFMTATYSNANNSPTVTYYGLQDFTSSGATLQTTTLTSGATTTDLKVTGVMKLQTGSSIDLVTNGGAGGLALLVKNISTGADSTGGTIQGTWTLSGGSKLQATYADLAEWYTSDSEYEPGTVVVFGGDAETTVTKQFGDSRVAGVVTTAPAYVMNSELQGTRVCIALIGRTPVKVLGTVKKGDLITTASVAGYGCKAVNPQFGTIIGKALEDKTDTGFGVIEVAVGRM